MDDHQWLLVYHGPTSPIRAGLWGWASALQKQWNVLEYDESNEVPVQVPLLLMFLLHEAQKEQYEE